MGAPLLDVECVEIICTATSPRRSTMSRKSDADNHANQMNPNNDAYWSARDESRPSEHEEPKAATPAPIPSGDDKK